MAKKNNSNKKLIISIVSAVVGVAALVGTYFIGYNVGRNSFIQEGNSVVTYNDQYSKIVGVFKRSYYNNYNKSVDSFAVFRDDGTCYYIDSVRTDLSTTVDFNDRSQECTYTFDENTRSGTFTINYPYTDSTGRKDNFKEYNFTFNGSLMIGAASYGRIQ